MKCWPMSQMVISGHPAMSELSPLYPESEHSCAFMSTRPGRFAGIAAMAGLETGRLANVRFTPEMG
jgi:hypothetical protein